MMGIRKKPEMVRGTHNCQTCIIFAAIAGPAIAPATAPRDSDIKPDDLLGD